MKFYSGFSLKNDISFFKEYICEDELCVVGFSYGAINAFRDVLDKKVKARKVILLSPAFFQNMSSSYKKLQLRAYKKDKNKYIENFIKNSFEPYVSCDVDSLETSLSQLEDLLYYEWNKDEIKALNIEIEVILGEDDKITDIKSASEFFSDIAQITIIKKANHFLRTE